MSLARDDDLFQDGIRVVVDWDAMGTGDSVFVPCLDTSRLMREARKIFSSRGWTPRFSAQPENHILGVRIWRIT